ncbi:MAG: hypothetical protein JWL69_4958 [Phycisphaerales bacterium]|jgi:GxxExxY protein|nr:hypothetical protein [Phycisphaerales bacterium]MDB5356378.1 hypothetical protein [Phycisphaerales bacterium]
MAGDFLGTAASVRDPQTYAIIGAAMEVHRILGPGFLEAVYKDALEIEFKLREIPYLREVPLTVYYKEWALDSTYRADFVCFTDIIVEAKAISVLSNGDRAQTIHYLRITHHRRGMMLNFGAASLEFERLVC